MQHPVDRHQEVDAAAFGPVDPPEAAREFWAQWLRGEVGREFLRQQGVVAERVFLRIRLQEEVERVVHRHVHDHIHRDLEFAGLLGEHQARLVVGKGVLLPIDEMPGRLHLQCIRDDLAAAMWRRAQAYDLRSEGYPAVVAVVGDVVQGGVDRHTGSRVGAGRPGGRRSSTTRRCADTSSPIQSPAG